jgi:hypothetical protein
MIGPDYRYAIYYILSCDNMTLSCLYPCVVALGRQSVHQAVSTVVVRAE